MITEKLPSASRSLLLGCAVFLGGIFVHESVAADNRSVRLSSIQGVAKIQDEDVIVTVVLAVPPGQDARAAGRRALRNIQPDAREIDSSKFVLTGSFWGQFEDANPGNDFVEVFYNEENVPGYLTLNDAEFAFQSSMATWGAVADSNFEFSFGGKTGRCPSLVAECRGRQFFDGFNDVTWLDIRESNVLGVTWSGTSTAEFDMAIDNRDFTWYTGDPSNVPASEIDLQTVMTHEFGHAAGIGHSEIGGSVMEAYYGGARRELRQDDIDALVFLYPASTGGEDPGPGEEQDLKPPVISNVAGAKLHKKNGRFEITWTTDEPSDSVVHFLSPSVQTFSDAGLVTSHAMGFRGTPGETYDFEVISTDASGNASAPSPGSHQN